MWKQYSERIFYWRVAKKRREKKIFYLSNVKEGDHCGRKRIEFNVT